MERQPRFGPVLSSLVGLTNLTGWPDRDPVNPYGAYTAFIVPRFPVAAILAGLDRIRAASDKAVDKARDRGQPIITMERPDNGLPEDIREHMRLMCDIIALGFQTDKTRVASLLLCRDISGLIYPFLGVRSGHHGASHYDESDAYQRITTYYCSQYAYQIGRAHV